MPICSWHCCNDIDGDSTQIYLYYLTITFEHDSYSKSPMEILWADFRAHSNKLNNGQAYNGLGILYKYELLWKGAWNL